MSSRKKNTVSLNNIWLKCLGLLVLLQQAAYWGYRFGRDECLFQHCTPSSDALSVATRLAVQAERRNLDATGYNLKRGIVLTSQCSGSEWIVSSLNQVPGVTWHLERMIRYSRSYMKDAEWERMSWETYREELERSFTPTSLKEDDPEVTPPDPKDTAPPVMVGFKLMYDQIPQHLRLPFAEWLEENEIFVVHLRRKCAALQFASQMDKYMRQYRHKIWKDHVYSKEEADALNKKKNWEITLQDVQGQNRWLKNVQLLEGNQEDFARYLHVYAAQTPVFEFSYESVDGPFQSNWFNALYAFLGLDFQYQMTASKTVKTGKRTCEDRIAGLGGASLPFLDHTGSRVECLRMRALAGVAANHTSTVQSLQQLGVSDVFLPPSDGRCRLGPNCQQQAYGKFQDVLSKRKKQAVA